MSLNDFYIKELLGKGSFGSVHKVQRKSDKKIYALKQIKIAQLKEKDKKNSLNEIRILASLSHKNIIGYKESFFDEDSKTLNIIMEYADDGDISIKIKNNIRERILFTEKTIWNWVIQLLEGINYLHENGIMHRDLKSANLFLLKNNILKIGDLNVSIISKNGMAYTQTGTPYYAPPEIWKDHPYNFKCDIWSAGCIIYEICTLHPPFRGTNFKELFNNIIKGKYNDINSIYSDDLRNLLKMMIVVNPDKRWDAKRILGSDILKRKMKEMNFKEEDFSENNKALLMQTIKIPRNMKEINNNLPKKYIERTKREEEMMKNDEFETAKHTFYQTLMKTMKKEKEGNTPKNNNNESNKSNDNNNGGNIRNLDYNVNKNPNYGYKNNNYGNKYNNDNNKNGNDLFTEYYNKIKSKLEENRNKYNNLYNDNEKKNEPKLIKETPIKTENENLKNSETPTNNQIEKLERNNEKMKIPLNQISKPSTEKEVFPVNNIPSNNLLNYRPQSEASRLLQIRNNSNYIHFQNNNDNINKNNENIFVNRNYLNEYIEKEREKNEKKKELEMNKNFKLLELKDVNKKSDFMNDNKIKKRPPSANYNYFNKVQNNYPVFQFQKKEDYKNRKITYGKIEYQKKGSERLYNNIPIQLKYLNNNNYLNNHNNNNFFNNYNNLINNNNIHLNNYNNLNYNKNYMNNNYNNFNNNNNYKPKYSIEKMNFNNNNYGNKSNKSRGGPRVFLWNE